MFMTLQILHHEFLGPVPLSDWGPPMAETVYVLLSRNKERFTILFADECQKTAENDYFTKNPLFKNWLREAGGEKNLYICILPLPDSDERKRRDTVARIVSAYKPACNFQEPS